MGVELPFGFAKGEPLALGAGRLAQLVRAPASHAGGRWFESSIAHHESGRSRAPGGWIGRSGGTADALRSGRSVPRGRVGSNPTFGTNARDYGYNLFLF